MKIKEIKKIGDLEIAIVYCTRCKTNYKAWIKRGYSFCPYCKTKHELAAV